MGWVSANCSVFSSRNFSFIYYGPCCGRIYERVLIFFHAVVAYFKVTQQALWKQTIALKTGSLSVAVDIVSVTKFLALKVRLVWFGEYRNNNFQHGKMCSLPFRVNPFLIINSSVESRPVS